MKFNLTFPKDYSVLDLQSRKVDFEVKVNAVKEPQRPKLDLKFVKSYGPFKTIDEFKTELKRQLQVEKDNYYDQQYVDQLLSKLSDNLEVQLPDSMIESEYQNTTAEEHQRVLSQGLTWSEYLKSINEDEESYQKKLKAFCVLRIKTGLAIGEVSQKEEITITNEEVDQYIEDLKARYQDAKARDEINNPINRSSFKAQILTSKTIDRLKELVKDN